LAHSGSSLLLSADFHITSQTTFSPVADVCFFVNPIAIGHLMSIATLSSRRLLVQFFVNNSNVPHYECSSFPNQTLRCSSRCDQSFFRRISRVAGAPLSLEIDCAITYTADPTNRCLISQIPTAVMAVEDSVILQPQNFCVTRAPVNVKFVVKCRILLSMVVCITGLGQ
jgi:hypothetical protein